MGGWLGRETSSHPLLFFLEFYSAVWAAFAGGVYWPGEFLLRILGPGGNGSAQQPVAQDKGKYDEPLAQANCKRQEPLGPVCSLC